LKDIDFLGSHEAISKAADKVFRLLAEEGLLVCEAREVLRRVEERLEMVKLPNISQNVAGRARQEG
jgi:hypothetical protein